MQPKGGRGGGAPGPLQDVVIMVVVVVELVVEIGAEVVVVGLGGVVEDLEG
jgi:hypothetical protein